MSTLTDELIDIAEGGCECESTDECDGTCGPGVAERAAKRIAELVAERNDVTKMFNAESTAKLAAVERIAELEAENSKLRKALKPIADKANDYIESCVKAGVNRAELEIAMERGECGTQHTCGTDALRALLAMHAE